MFNRLLKTFVSLMSSVLAVGCSHTNNIEDSTKGIYGPLDAVERSQAENHPSSGDEVTQLSNEMHTNLPTGVATYGPLPTSTLRLKTSQDEQVPKEDTQPTEADELPTEAIVEDITENYVTIDAELLSITTQKKGCKVKLNAGKAQGVTENSVGEFYVGDQIIAHGRFKVTSVSDKSCIAMTNAIPKQLRETTRVVIKIPNNVKSAAESDI